KNPDKQTTAIRQPDGAGQRTVKQSGIKTPNIARHTVEFSKDTHTTSPTDKPDPKVDHLGTPTTIVAPE
ncbi:hypothetical protein ACFO4M_14100, partial [Pseudonocardia nematodicida]|uniref:hypothetical protein n=1 Tax=Pseudonocardia nematodicida TaxID=1206997 RepID=UPI003611668C